MPPTTSVPQTPESVNAKLQQALIKALVLANGVRVGGAMRLESYDREIAREIAKLIREVLEEPR